MGQRQKAKPKRKSQKNTDKEQSERFVETARTLGISDGEDFDRALKRLLPAKAVEKGQK